VTASVQVRDNGANRLIRVVGSGPGSVDVGVIGTKADQAYTDGVTVAQIAEWAEFGIGQPMRSWLREWIEQNEEPLRQVQRNEYRQVLTGAQTKEQALARIGVWITGQIQARIAEGIDPENAESTIAQKGSDTPLIDKGQFRSSITNRVNR
jgi:hypothetical protein